MVVLADNFSIFLLLPLLLLGGTVLFLIALGLLMGGVSWLGEGSSDRSVGYWAAVVACLAGSFGCCFYLIG